MKIWIAGERLTAADLNGNFANPARATGTFVPAISGSTTAGVGTYTAQSGRYYRIGELVFFELTLIWTAHTGTGNLLITGLPFQSATGGQSHVIPIASTGLAAEPIGTIGNLLTQIALADAATGAALAMDPAATIRASGVYRTTAA